MALAPLTAILETGSLAIERIWPDPVKRAEEVRKLEELKLKGSWRSTKLESSTKAYLSLAGIPGLAGLGLGSRLSVYFIPIDLLGLGYLQR